jgi:hypothetical protein
MIFIDMGRFGINILYNNGLGGKYIRVVLYLYDHFGNIEFENSICINLFPVISRAWFEVFIDRKSFLHG